jgi:hypothetical protein
MKTGTALLTIAEAYKQITVEGKRPWTPLGNFLNDWNDYHRDKRQRLVQDPPAIPAEATQEQQRWATFCAASVEYLCQLAEIPCPEWVHDPAYNGLTEPWYYSLGAHKPEVHARLEAQTHEIFKERNIYCGNRLFMNKYEERTSQRQSA